MCQETDKREGGLKGTEQNSIEKLTEPAVYKRIDRFRLDLSAYILCLLSSIDLLASSKDDACARDSASTLRMRAVEANCRDRTDTAIVRDGPGIDRI